MILPECRWMWDGIEHADSVVVNPHKWLGAVFDCSLYYVRDRDHLVRVLSTNPSYLRTAADGKVRNYRDWGIALGRRFRALKLWCLIRSEGVSGLQARLRRDIANAQWLAEQVRATPNWRVVAPVPLQTVCVRHEPSGLLARPSTRTRAWADRVNRSGRRISRPRRSTAVDGSRVHRRGQTERAMSRRSGPRCDARRNRSECGTGVRPYPGEPPLMRRSTSGLAVAAQRGGRAQRNHPPAAACGAASSRGAC